MNPESPGLRRRPILRSTPQVALALAALLPQLSYGHDGQPELDTAIVTASRLERTLSELTASIEIITQEQIHDRLAPDLAALLSQVAGVNMIQQGGRGGGSNVLLRGGEPNFTLVLIDGVKVNDPTNAHGGSYDFSSLDLSSIRRIEIVRSPMSALYGSDALAGVINIITTGGTPGLRIAAGLGDRGLRSTSVELGRRSGRADSLIGVHALADGGAIDGDSYRDWGVNGHLHLALADPTDLELVLRHQHASSDSFPEESGGPRFALIRDVDQRAVEESHAHAVLTHAFRNGWTARLAGSHFEHLESHATPGIAPGASAGVPPAVTDSALRRSGITLSLATSLSPSLSLLLGTEWQDESGTSTGYLDLGFPVPTHFSQDRDTFSAFTEVHFRSGPVVLHGSVRRDAPDIISAETSGRLGVAVTLPRAAGELRANWGQGFKAPSFYALAHPLIGNPALLSESATSYDIGYRSPLRAESLNFAVSLYHSAYENLVDFDPRLFALVNRSMVVSEGAELSTTFALGDTLRVSGNLSLLATDIRGSDAVLRGRPRWRAGAVVDWAPHPDWRLVTSLAGAGQSQGHSVPTGEVTLGGYGRVDVALTFQPNQALSIGLAIDNLLDGHWQEAVGFTTAGRRGRLSLRYDLQR
ncbi:MAG: TonB-dependent receptor [Gammaproteobacteria bacterium]|nr:MAG: TonB-dependent receptor [Gammaproteobacteria bacterium]